MPENKKNFVLFKKMKKFKQENDLKNYYSCRDELILKNIELVYWISKKFFYAKISTEDITQIGIIGLMNAIDRYDVEKGIRFSSFAVPTIIGEIKRYIRDKAALIHVPRKVYESKIKISKLLNNSNRSLTVKEILRESPDISESEIIDYLTDMSRTVVSADYLLESGYELSENKFSELFSDKYRFIEQEIAKFPEQERKIIKLYYIENYTQVEIADKIGCSQMHISRILKRITKKLIENKEKDKDENESL